MSCVRVWCMSTYAEQGWPKFVSVLELFWSVLHNHVPDTFLEEKRGRDTEKREVMCAHHEQSAACTFCAYLYLYCLSFLFVTGVCVVISKEELIIYECTVCVHGVLFSVLSECTFNSKSFAHSKRTGGS